MKLKKIIVPIVILTLLSGVWFFLATLQYRGMEEDAFILFRYAETFAKGGGLTYNGLYEGCYERVAGYSNLIWVLLMALTVKLGAYTPTSARIMLLCFGAVDIVLLYLISRKISRTESPLNYLASALLATNIPFLWYGPGGMEPALYIMVCLGAVYAFLYEEERPSRYFPASAILLGLLAMVHPEAPLYFIGLLVWRMVMRRRRWGWHRSDWVWFFTFWAIYFLFLIWHTAYYKDPFPTTFYNKGVGHISKPLFGLKYLWNFFMDSRGYILFAPILIPLFLRKGYVRNSRLYLFVLCVLAGIGFVLVSGGDNKSHYRFIVPFVPFLFLLSQEGLRRLVEYIRRRSFKLAGIIIIISFIAMIGVNIFLFVDYIPQGNILTTNLMLFTQKPSYFADKLNYSFERYSTHPSAQIGMWLKENIPTNKLLACGQSGQIPYYADMANFDIMGFNDPIIPKLRPSRHWDYNGYVVSRRPKFICDALAMFNGYGSYNGQKLLVDDGRFQEWYYIFVVFEINHRANGRLLNKNHYILFKRDHYVGRTYDFDEYMEEFMKYPWNVVEIEYDDILTPDGGKY